MEKGSSSSSSVAVATATGSADSLNGLAFGKKIYFEGPKAPPATPPSPAKKGRTGLVQAGQPPRCQVEGCMLDLSDAKAYYSRHKVCGVHSKTAKVIVAGLEQRFCQQCSRFHQLPEFDQGKRSCRRRLAGHNERRRKPPPGSLLPPYYGTTYSPNPMFDNRSKAGGGFMMDFSAAYPGTHTAWPNTITTISTPNHQSATSAKPQLPWQSNSLNPIFNIHHHQGNASRSGTPIPSEECYIGVSDSTSALSLLSNKPWVARSPPSTLVANDFLSTGGNGVTCAQPPPPINPGGQFATWGFKGTQPSINSSNAVHDIPPDMGGLAQFSHPANGGEYGEELGLGHPNELQFHELDHSNNIQHMHWSL